MAKDDAPTSDILEGHKIDVHVSESVCTFAVELCKEMFLQLSYNTVVSVTWP